ncbi:MAG: hypothetical protein IKH57_19780 [Clostridia bacterium]|nr:hypothetical protein [Clostridia bacterium]
MKKLAALLLAAMLLCSCVTALAAGMPDTASFATLKVAVDGDIVTVTLSKPVDKLYANWPSEFELVELAVSDSLKASVFTGRHNYQMGVLDNGNDEWGFSKCTGKWYLKVGTKYDRAFVTLQGDWIVSYNRNGDLVDVVAAKSKDVYAIRTYAFR